ncbi:MAG TPA: hypothetical protein VKC61_21545, partial [Pyrinomonadaceae bacterium]|nr:hypothetical protein [Pyrinomonadaceae bacterium]
QAMASRAWGTDPQPVPSPRKWATDEMCKKHCLRRLLRRLFEFGGPTPGSASPSPGATILSARFAGSLDETDLV